MKLCKNCKYINIARDGDVCTNPKSKPRVEPIHGKVYYVSCSYQRSADNYTNSDKCGAEGDWFEAKEGFFYKLSRLLREGGE
jgi:hypothetical protein